MFSTPEPRQTVPGQRPTRRLLVIDDDVELCTLVAEFLRREDFDTEFVHDGFSGLKAALEGNHEAIILDIMLPGLDGFEVLRRIRERKRTPILMLTARGDHVDRVVGLEMGADDYVPKPFDPRELVARIRAVLRRSPGRLLTRDQISRATLGRPLDPLDHSVNMHISNLRRKLGADEGGASIIRTVRSAGYLLSRSSPDDTT